MPVWQILLRNERTETVEADVIHHDATGSLYFSLQVDDNEFIICRAYAARHWKDLLLTSFQSTKSKTKIKLAKEQNDYNH
jgi:hypothetical protein